MPSGVRNRGQYRLLVWWPNGDRSGRQTTKNLTADEFGAALREDISEMLARLEKHEAARAAQKEALKDL
jgi:hypothetical protein